MRAFELELLAEIEALGKNATLRNLIQMMMIGPWMGIAMDPYPLKNLRLMWPVNILKFNIALANLEHMGLITEVRAKPRTFMEQVNRMLPHSRYSRMEARYTPTLQSWPLLVRLPPRD